MTNLLNIDLTSQRVWQEDVEALRRDYIGGGGINARLAYDLIPRGVNPLGDENVLIFGVGPFVGTNIPTACRTEVTAKSPLTDSLGTSSSGLYWGAQLRYAGFDHIAIFGRSPSSVYLLIRNGEVRIKDASQLKGKNTWETVEALRRQEGEGVQIASIGEGGEKMVRFASIQNNLHHAWGRTGLGGVMGSKNVKAIVIYGEHPLTVSDLGETLKIAREATTRITEDDSFGYTRRYGSMVAADPYNRLGALPGYNFTQGSLEDWADTRGRRAFAQRYKEKDLACFACPIACAHWSQVKEGESLGYQFHGLEVTYDLEFGARLGIASIPEISRCVDLCNQYGLDVISTAGTIAYLIECYQHGMVGKDEIGGEIAWGDAAGISRLITMSAHREGMGDVLAEGVRRASATIKGSEQYALHIKGGEIPVRDPRAKWDVWSLGYLTNIRGGDHLRTRSPAENLLGATKNHLEEELAVMVKEQAVGAYSLQEVAERLSPPRIAWLMLPAGQPVDDHIDQLKALFSSGDIIIDGGNTYYKDDIRRSKILEENGIRFIDAGVSGGIWGLKVGYCTMIGGDEDTFHYLEPIFETLAPEDGYLHCGAIGSGHFVKMVHNGIEYGMMQAYGEGFEILEASEYGDYFNYAEIAHLWNQGSVVRSWLLELLEPAFGKDPRLTDIQGFVEDSGEGRWTLQQAIETDVPAEVIAISLMRRFRSRQENTFTDRVLAALRREFGGHAVKTSTP